MANTKKYVSLDKLGLYDEKIKKVISDGDAATLASAQEFATNLGSNYDAAGLAATAEANAKSYTDTQIATVNTAVAEAKTQADKGVTDAATADGKAVAAQTAADNAQAAVDALDAYVGDIPENYTEETIVAYINKKAEETLNAASGGSSESAASVLAALNTYKAENDPKVAANTTAAENAQAAADSAQEYAEGVAADLDAEEKARADADTALDGRIATLEGTITGLSGAMHFEGVKDAVPEDVSGYEQGDVIIVGNKEYVLNGTAFVEFGDASVNAEAITALTGRVSTLEGEMDTAQADIEAVEGAVATKAEQTALDEAVEALEGADEAQIGRIAALEAKFGEGEGSVSDQIADAKQEAIDAAASASDTKDAAILAEAKKYADDEDAKIKTRVDALETASATHALASDLTALAGRVTTAEGEIDTLQTEMDAVEAKAAANETAIGTLNTTVADKAAQTDLDNAVARIAANESAIAAFVEVSEEEINALFTA